MTTEQLPTRTGRAWRWARMTLLAAWVAVLALGLLLGTRSGSWNDLEAAVSEGSVTSVRVTGELEAGATGYDLAEVRWRDGPVLRRTEVLQVSSPAIDTRNAATGDVVVTGSVVDALAALRPGLSVEQAPFRDSSTIFYGWRLDGALGTAAFLTALLTLLLLVAGPQPWRATRWAWFWLATTPLGAVAFLVLAGPTRGLRAPRDVTRRLTGGRALVLAVAVGVLVATVS